MLRVEERQKKLCDDKRLKRINMNLLLGLKVIAVISIESAS